VEVVTKVLNTLVGKIPIIPLPAEVLSNVATGLERLSELQNIEVGDIDSLVLGEGLVLPGA